MKCKAIPGLDTEEKCLTCQDKASTMWHASTEGRSLSFEFFLITIPTQYLMLYLQRSCVTAWEHIYAFPEKVQRRDGIQRTPPKSCITQPGICSGRTLGVHPVLHRYHWWSEKIPNSWSLYFDSKSSQSTGEMRKARKVFPPLETSQKLLRTRSLRPTVQLKCSVKGALFLKGKKKKLQLNFKYFSW